MDLVTTPLDAERVPESAGDGLEDVGGQREGVGRGVGARGRGACGRQVPDHIEGYLAVSIAECAPLPIVQLQANDVAADNRCENLSQARRSLIHRVLRDPLRKQPTKTPLVTRTVSSATKRTGSAP